MDGIASEDFDLVEKFIARHAIDLAVAERAMGTPSLEIARMIVDINVPRPEVLAIVGGCTPTKLVDIMNRMNVLEMMMGLAKMRARRTPANQAHVTNRKEHPALLAAAAAEAGGYRQLAENLRRAAELTGLPNDRVFDIYAMRRPGRASVAELHDLAAELRRQDMPRVAAFIAEAADAYGKRGIAKRA